jgi:hypothetical protein
MEEPITKSKVLEVLAPILPNTLTSKGFKYYKSKVCALKKTDFGFIEYTIIVNNYWPLHQETALVFSVRYDIIEEIRAMFYNERFRGMKSVKTEPTLVIYIPLVEGNDRVNISTIENLNLIATKTPQKINNEGFILEAKYSNINNVGLYFKNKYLTNVNLPFQAYIVILIALKVSGDPDYEKYRDEISKKTSDSPYKKTEEKEAVYECISYLDKYAT